MVVFNPKLLRQKIRLKLMQTTDCKQLIQILTLRSAIDASLMCFLKTGILFCMISANLNLSIKQWMRYARQSKLRRRYTVCLVQITCGSYVMALPCLRCQYTLGLKQQHFVLIPQQFRGSHLHMHSWVKRKVQSSVSHFRKQLSDRDQGQVA